MREKINIGNFKSLPRLYKIVTFTIIALFIIALVVTLFISSKKRQNKIAPPIAAPSGKVIKETNRTTLSLIPAKSGLAVGQTLPVSVMLTGEKVEAVDIVLTYNPTFILIDKITPGKAFPVILRNEQEEGKILFSASLPPENLKELADGEIFSFTITARTATPAAVIDFDSLKTIAAKNGKHFLSTTYTGIYKIQ